MHSPPTPNQPDARRRKPGGAVVRTFLVIGALVALILGISHVWLASKVRSRLAPIRAAHKPVTLVELNAYYRDVPAESNAAVVYKRAFDVLKTNEAFNSLEKLEDQMRGAEPLPVELRKSMEKACEENAKTFEELQAAARFEQCRYPIDYRPGYAALLPHLSGLSKCATLEMYRGVLQEQKGDIPQVIATIETIMRMGASLDAEPDLISVLIQNKLHYRSSDVLAWLLNHRRLTLEQLAELQQIFQRAERTNSLERALIGERCSTLALFDSSAAEILNVIDPTYEKRVLAISNLRFLRLAGTLKKDEIRFLDGMSECEEILSEPLADGLKHAETLRLKVQSKAHHDAILTRVLLPGILKGMERNVQRVAQQRLIQTALAVEKYRKTQNRLPNSLAELRPRSEIPTDPFDDEEIRYRIEGEGYVIYSVGPDCIDDGGKKQIPRTAKIDRPKGDIVFAVSRKSERKR